MGSLLPGKLPADRGKKSFYGGPIAVLISVASPREESLEINSLQRIHPAT